MLFSRESSPGVFTGVNVITISALAVIFTQFWHEKGDVNLRCLGSIE